MDVSEYLQASMRASWSQAENREDGGKDTGDKRQYLQWQNNLLDHIDAVQDEVSHRMDFIERELDGKRKVGQSCMFLCVNKPSPLVFAVLFLVLESWLDYTGELEPPEPLARLPQLKQRMKRLLSQLGKVQQIALYSSTWGHQRSAPVTAARCSRAADKR